MGEKLIIKIIHFFQEQSLVLFKKYQNKTMREMKWNERETTRTEKENKGKDGTVRTGKELRT